MKKKNHVFYVFCVFSLITMSVFSEGSLTVIPSNPTVDDSISIELSTWLPNPGVVVTGADQTVNGCDIYLDLFTYQLPGNWLQVVIDYDLTFPIGNLPVGIYQVQARQYDGLSLVPYYVQSTSFEVTPEPCTLLLLSLGGLLIRKR